MKMTKLAIAMALMPFTVNAQMVPAIQPVVAVMEPSGMDAPITLTPNEKRALAIADKWKKNPDKPAPGEDGSVQYMFGYPATLVCAKMHVCGVRLQAGEQVTKNVVIGDSRWPLTGSVSGKGASAVTTIFVKPKEANMSTNMVITTDRRVYMVDLKSTSDKWMPFISFHYPDEAENLLASVRAQYAQTVNSTTLSTGENVLDLDFEYRMTGDSPKWKPVRVYNDGKKTIIQFPSAHFADEAPAFLVQGKGGGLFSGPPMQQVNYRLIGDRFVIDQVVEKGVLISGVGDGQTKITIEHVGGSR